MYVEIYVCSSTFSSLSLLCTVHHGTWYKCKASMLTGLALVVVGGQARRRVRQCERAPGQGTASYRVYGVEPLGM